MTPPSGTHVHSPRLYPGGGLAAQALLALALLLTAACNTGPCKTGTEPVIDNGKCQCSDGTALEQSECKNLSTAGSKDAGERSDAGSGHDATDADATLPADGGDASSGGDARDALTSLLEGRRTSVGELTFLLTNGCANEAAVGAAPIDAATLPELTGYDSYAAAFDIIVEGVSDACLRVTLPLDESDDNRAIEILRDGEATQLSVLEQTISFVTIAIERSGVYTVVRHSNTVMLYDFESATASATGSFQADDGRPHSGRQSAHPLHLAANATSSMIFDCDAKTHTELSLWYLSLSPSAGQSLTLWIDGEQRMYVGGDSVQSAGFQKASFVLGSGQHSYRLEASVVLAGQPPFWVDDIRCIAQTPQTNTSGVFDFEAGIVPVEVSGDFVIDDFASHSQSHAAHPKTMKAAGTASMTLDCSRFAQGKLRFFYRSEPRSESDTLSLYVDEVLAGTYGSTQDESGAPTWAEVTVPVEATGHTYRWEVLVSDAGEPPFWLDDIRCE